LTHRAIEKLYPVEILNRLREYFDLNWRCNRLHYSSTVVCARYAATTAISGIIISIIPIAGPVIASLGLFQTWNKNREEERRRPAIDFDGF
jgi:hypothetical protein